jgi:hypothetical protein
MRAWGRSLFSDSESQDTSEGGSDDDDDDGGGLMIDEAEGEQQLQQPNSFLCARVTGVRFPAEKKAPAFFPTFPNAPPYLLPLSPLAPCWPQRNQPPRIVLSLHLYLS